jgi:hypothetical protein
MRAEQERVLRDRVSAICGHVRKAASLGRVSYRQEDVWEGSPTADALRDLGFALSFGSRVIPPEPDDLEAGDDEGIVVAYADISGWGGPVEPDPASTGPLHACRVAYAARTRSK